MKMRIRVLVTVLLLVLLLGGCSEEAGPASAPASGTAENMQSAGMPGQPAGNSEEKDQPTALKGTGEEQPPPTPPVAVPDRSGYFEYAERFFRALKRGDAFAASSYIWFEKEEDRALWLERFEAPYNAKLKDFSSVSLNLWAATVEEDLGADVPAQQTVYYVAWYDESYRIFTDPSSLPADLLRDRDYSGMPLPEEVPTGKKPKPGEDEFPPEDGQAEKWYREQQAELAAVRAAADRAVRALPEANTVTSFDDPNIELVDASKVSFIKIEPKGSKLLLYAVSYPTTADAILGPITVYLDSEANILGFAPRE